MENKQHPVKTDEKDKPDCAGHKKDLFGESYMPKVARAIADMNYETLAELFNCLTHELEIDATNDSIGGRSELSKHLFLASEVCVELNSHLYKAWQVSKPFMKQG